MSSVAASIGSEASGVHPREVPPFEWIYEREFAYVWNSLRRLGIPDRHLADCAHDVFLVVHRQMDRYEPTRPLRPWLFGIAYRTALALRRKAGFRREVLDDAAPEPVQNLATPEDQVSATETRAHVVQALQSLKPERRAVFVLHDIDGVPIPDAAQALGIPLNTAYSRLRRARSQFISAYRRAERGGIR